MLRSKARATFECGGNCERAAPHTHRLSRNKVCRPGWEMNPARSILPQSEGISECRQVVDTNDNATADGVRFFLIDLLRLIDQRDQIRRGRGISISFALLLHN